MTTAQAILLRRLAALSAADSATKRKVFKVLEDWQQHAEDFENTPYWEKRFAPFLPIFDAHKPKKPVLLFRSERTDIDNKYEQRYTSWSYGKDIENFGWGERRLVSCVFRPEDILADFTELGVDPNKENMREVIIKPGKYAIIPDNVTHDRQGSYNMYEQPLRFRDRYSDQRFAPRYAPSSKELEDHKNAWLKLFSDLKLDIPETDVLRAKLYKAALDKHGDEHESRLRSRIYNELLPDDVLALYKKYV